MTACREYPSKLDDKIQSLKLSTSLANFSHERTQTRLMWLEHYRLESSFNLLSSTYGSKLYHLVPSQLQRRQSASELNSISDTKEKSMNNKNLKFAS